jgi:hypothetical protein
MFSVTGLFEAFFMSFSISVGLCRAHFFRSFSMSRSIFYKMAICHFCKKSRPMLNCNWWKCEASADGQTASASVDPALALERDGPKRSLPLGTGRHPRASSSAGRRALASSKLYPRFASFGGSFNFPTFGSGATVLFA